MIAEKVDKHIILGDINERAKILGGGNTQVYSTFDDLLNLNNYSIFNNGSPTREQKYGNSVQRSAIDITLGSPQISKFLESWHIDDESSSDHYPIITRLKWKIKRREVRKKVSQANYGELRSEFIRLYDLSTGDPGSRFLDTMMSLKKYKSTYEHMHAPCKWWNKSLQNLKRRRNRARSKKQWEKYVELKRSFRREFRRSRKRYFSTRLDELARSNHPWKIVKELFPQLRKLKRQRSEIDTQSAQEVVATLAKSTVL